MSKLLKRKRTDATKSLSKKQKLNKAARQGPLVRGDALKWKEVQLPDRMDDAEGFYGLEEIDDVEIIKDENGHLSFRPKTADDVIVGEGEVPGEEWSGFDSESETAQNNSEPLSATTESNHGSELESTIQKVSRQQEASDGTKKSKQKKAKKEKVPASKPTSTAEEPTELEDEIDYNALDEVEDRTEADITAWKELHLSDEMLLAISKLGFSEPTPIQKSAIPSISDGRDVIGKAVTGSGKTLAFGIPIIEKWLELNTEQAKSEPSIPTAFILAPTRELAHQLSKHIIALSQGLERSPRIATVTGGLALVKQQRQLEYADIIIGTPGRLWEVINNSHGLIERLKQIQFLVIDEADRLLSEGHFKEVEEILSVLNRKITDETEEDGRKSSVKPTQTQTRQTLVFSATFHKGLQQRLASKQKWQSNDSGLLSNSQSLDYLLKKLRFQRGIKPTFVDANPTTSMSENLSESILECGAMQKDLYLYSLLLLHQHQHQYSKPSLLQTTTSTTTDNSNPIARTLIFTNSISTVKRLTPLLTTLSIPHTHILPLHSSMPQKSRLRSLERFTTPPPNPTTTTTNTILISTDVAARGLDIKNVNTVIHYHVPRTADTYVHRSGRTARANTHGRSILLCSPDEVAHVTRLIGKIHADHLSTRNRNNKGIGKGAISTIHLPANLSSQLSRRVSLAQKISATTQDTVVSKGEDSWLRNAAEELGVDYESEEFEEASRKGRRGRGGGREIRKKEAVAASEKGDVRVWKRELEEELKKGGRRVDFGDGIITGGGGAGGVGKGGRGGGKFLAGGAIDVDGLLERGL